MAEPSGSPRDEPLVQPRLIRFLKERPRLIDRGAREEFWATVEENVVDRRKPDKAAERAVQKFFEEMGQNAGPVARNRVRDRLEDANESVLNRL